MAPVRILKQILVFFRLTVDENPPGLLCVCSYDPMLLSGSERMEEYPPLESNPFPVIALLAFLALFALFI